MGREDTEVIELRQRFAPAIAGMGTEGWGRSIRIDHRHLRSSPQSLGALLGENSTLVSLERNLLTAVTCERWQGWHRHSRVPCTPAPHQNPAQKPTACHIPTKLIFGD